MIDQLTIDKIKDSASIVDVVRDFYDLRKSGVNYTCRCPFHDEKTPGAFILSPKKNVYTCFGCGEHGNAVDFLMKHENLSFMDAIRWLGKKYNIDVEGAERFSVRQCTPRPQQPPLQTLILPISMAKDKVNTSDNTLCNWLRSLPWDGAQAARLENTLKAYLVGHSKQGHTMFWQIDEQFQLRTGKMMLYKPDGHRDKESRGNFNWVHSALERANHPAYNTETHDARPTLFGMHLLNLYPRATVNIVESEKTALICAIAYGTHAMSIWMATGGQSMLNREKLEPIIKQGRHIVLYPDKDAVDHWKEIAARIDYKRLHINTDVLKDYWQPADGEKADIADVLVRIIKTNRKPKTIDDVLELYPQAKPLIDKLGLDVV